MQTSSINEACKDWIFLNEVQTVLQSHFIQDWGDLTQEDKDANNEALKSGDRILSAYNTSKGRIYINTEADRTSTLILFSNEY